VSYTDRLDQLTDAHRLTDARHPDRREAWRDARRATYVAVLADAAGVDPDALDADERRALDWLAGWDDPTVAGVAALLDRARGADRG
jgi:hypothetical protein